MLPTSPLGDVLDVPLELVDAEDAPLRRRAGGGEQAVGNSRERPAQENRADDVDEPHGNFDVLDDFQVPEEREEDEAQGEGHAAEQNHAIERPVGNLL
eukprot:CAMPEP_0197492094 /NCGR_PEP_ID=MMETSP1311-20131121/6576_1 /TAXON_ID=464262 /ORGANISM="Genus nov. species nov., Strain RCC856" /LENGTH=97 /DNA_ID=CAMNT_0043036835 /DNA_START=44 /DNA_END=337 /DNA_ORIENTATION=+